MKKINSKNDLPEEGIYVLARHNRKTWNDSTDQKNVNCVIVKLTKGISLCQREQMRKGLLSFEKEEYIHYDGSWDKPIHSEINRHEIYKPEDQEGNNLMPYYWQTFGATSFFGQEITQWTPIEPLKK